MKSGISFALFLSVLEFVLPLSVENRSHIRSSLAEAGKKCVSDHYISEDDITAFKERRFPDGENAACFSACVLTKIAVMDDKGNISPETVIEKAKAAFDNDEEVKVLKDFLDTCAKGLEGKELDKCEKAKQLFQCSMEKSKEFGF